MNSEPTRNDRDMTISEVQNGMHMNITEVVNEISVEVASVVQKMTMTVEAYLGDEQLDMKNPADVKRLWDHICKRHEQRNR